jgi:uncharacterized membrane protein
VDRSRLEAFSDGVFAVAITLLALNLSIEGRGVLHQLYLHRWSFAAYLISFLTIGIIWVNHHALVKSIKTVDRTLLFVNQLLLLFVVLIPVSTAVVAEYLPKYDWDARVATALYAGVFLGMSAGFGLIFEWTLHGERVYQPVPPERRWAARWRFMGGASVYVVALLVALVWAYVSFALMGLVAVYYIFENTPTAPAVPGEPGESPAPDSPGGDAPRT